MTGMRVIISDEALADVQLQSSWYAEEAGDDIAERYLESLNETLAVIARQSDLGRTRHFEHELLYGLRSLGMAGAFHKHLVFFTISRPNSFESSAYCKACGICPGD